MTHFYRKASPQGYSVCADLGHAKQVYDNDKSFLQRMASVVLVASKQKIGKKQNR